MPTPQQLLVVVAHPDDETFGTGSLLAHAARHGVEATVVCLTRGEAGTPTPGSIPDGVTLAATREAELRAAADLLGVHRVEVLGWRDSGMDDAPGEGSLCAVPLDDVVAALATLVEDVRPDVVVTLDGSDGHRDHVRAREATLAAVDGAAWSTPRTYLHCLPQRLMREWVEHLRARDPSAAHLGLGELGTPEHDITTRIDTSDLRALREAAMALHASQVPPYEVMPEPLRAAFLEEEALRRVRPPWDGGAVERDLFLQDAPGQLG